MTMPTQDELARMRILQGIATDQGLAAGAAYLDAWAAELPPGHATRVQVEALRDMYAATAALGPRPDREDVAVALAPALGRLEAVCPGGAAFAREIVDDDALRDRVFAELEALMPEVH